MRGRARRRPSRSRWRGTWAAGVGGGAVAGGDAAPAVDARQAYQIGREQYKKGDWSNARRNLEAARAGGYRTRLFEEAPDSMLGKMDRKEAADRAKNRPAEPMTVVQESAAAAAQPVEQTLVQAGQPVAQAPRTVTETAAISQAAADNTAAAAAAVDATAVDTAPPAQPQMSAKQAYNEGRKAYRDGDWIAARQLLTQAAASGYKPGLFEDSPQKYLDRMDKKESADRAKAEAEAAAAAARRAQEEQQTVAVAAQDAGAGAGTGAAGTGAAQPVAAAGQDAGPAAQGELRGAAERRQLEQEERRATARQRVQEALEAERANRPADAFRLYGDAINLDPNNEAGARVTTAWRR